VSEAVALPRSGAGQGDPALGLSGRWDPNGKGSVGSPCEENLVSAREHSGAGKGLKRLLLPNMVLLKSGSRRTSASTSGRWDLNVKKFMLPNTALLNFVQWLQRTQRISRASRCL
jgi:hypothetical protein